MATITGSNGSNLLIGTNSADLINQRSKARRNQKRVIFAVLQPLKRFNHHVFKMVYRAGAVIFSYLRAQVRYDFINAPWRPLKRK